MELVSADLLLPYMAPNFNTASSDLMRSCINRAAVTFCQKALAWVELLDAQPVINSISDYDLELPEDTKIVAPLFAWYGGTKLLGKSINNLNYDNPDWLNATGTPCYVTSISKNVIKLVPKPVSEPSRSTMRVMVALAPKLDNTAAKIPDELIYNHQDAIIAGAKAYMFEIKNQPWTSLIESDRERAKFYMEIGEARVEYHMGNLPSDQAIQ